MALSKEQAAQIKEQLISQVEKSFPADKKDFAVKQIQDMNEEQLEEFLKNNNLAQAEGSPTQGGQCIFCSIISGNMESFKIDENPDAIAVLEINPASRGHALIIPKEHLDSSEKITTKTHSLSKKVSRKIKSKLKPENIQISSANLFGHEIINLIPVYKEGSEDNYKERSPADQKDLGKLQNILQVKPKPKTVRKPRVKKVNKESSKEKIWLPKRIP